MLFVHVEVEAVRVHGRQARQWPATHTHSRQPHALGDRGQGGPCMLKCWKFSVEIGLEFNQEDTHKHTPARPAPDRFPAEPPPGGEVKLKWT